MCRIQVIRLSTLTMCVLLLGFVHPAQVRTYRVEQITPAQVGNTTYTISAGNQYLNNFGQVVGESQTYSDDQVYNTGPRAFRWSHGKSQSLGTLGSDALGYGVSSPAAINDFGLVAGRSLQFVHAIDHGLRAFVWWEGFLHRLETGAFVASEAVAMNAWGAVAGSGRRFEQGQDRGRRALLWTAKGLRDLGTLGVNASGMGRSVATALNTQRQVVGFSDVYDSAGNGVGRHAFVWADGVMHDLGVLGVDLGFSTSKAIAINTNNQVLGWSDVYDSAQNWLGPHAFLWTGGTMQDLGGPLCDVPEDEFEVPAKVLNLNDAGQVVGCRTHVENGVASGTRAFLYQNGAMVDLNTLVPADSGVLLENALAINNRGQITAFGTRTTGEGTSQVYVLLSPWRR